MLEATGVSLSASTLRRLWGRANYQHLPSVTTLNTLAQFAGYPDWRRFAQAQAVPVLPGPAAELPDSTTLPLATLARLPKPTRWQLSWLAGLVLTVGLLGLVARPWWPRPLLVEQYHFSSRPITRTIPNSVIFTYGAVAAPVDSVFIQQSWDPARRQWVARVGTTHTAIYYEPGF